MMAVSRMIRKEMRNAWKSGVEQGIAQGIIRGEKSGIKKGKIEMAKLMLLEKADIEFIERITGLSKKEILALQ